MQHTRSRGHWQVPLGRQPGISVGTYIVFVPAFSSAMISIACASTLASETTEGGMISRRACRNLMQFDRDKFTTFLAASRNDRVGTVSVARRSRRSVDVRIGISAKGCPREHMVYCYEREGMGDETGKQGDRGTGECTIYTRNSKISKNLIQTPSPLCPSHLVCCDLIGQITVVVKDEQSRVRMLIY